MKDFKFEMTEEEKTWQEEVSDKVIEALITIGDDDLVLKVYDRIDDIFEMDDEELSPYEEEFAEMERNRIDPEKAALYLLDLIIKKLDHEKEKKNQN